MLHFQVVVRKDRSLWFTTSSAKEDPNFSLLTYVFQYSSISWYQALLLEIEQIESGRLERNEEAGLVDLGDPGDLVIYKDKTILEREEEGKRLEITTSEFKQLIKDWIKFVDVNTKAFTSSPKM